MAGISSIRDLPSRQRILAEFDYDREKGTLTRKSDGKNPVKIVNGYPSIYINQMQCQLAHLIWIVETGQTHRGRLKRLNGKRDSRFKYLAETGLPNPLGRWINGRDDDAINRVYAWGRRTGVSVKDIGVMTLRLLDPGEDA